MFKEHYRKNNIFISSLFKHTAKQKNLFLFKKQKRGQKTFPFCPRAKRLDTKCNAGRHEPSSDEISKEIFLFWLRRSEVKALGRLGLLRTWGVVLRLKIPRARRVNRTLTRNRFEQRQLQADQN